VEDNQKLQAEVLQKDLAAYRKLETWGSSLFLGAIALLAKQFIEWDRAAAVNVRITPLEPWAFVTPALVGLAAFAFLRVVNFRGNRTSMALTEMVDASVSLIRSSWGSLGLLLAMMPLALGYAVSWLLVQGDPARQRAMSPVWWLGAMALVLGLLAHIVIRRRTGPRDSGAGATNGRA